jgi:hypothetical protein
VPLRGSPLLYGTGRAAEAWAVRVRLMFKSAEVALNPALVWLAPRRAGGAGQAMALSAASTPPSTLARSTWLRRPQTRSDLATRLGLIWLPGWPDWWHSCGCILQQPKVARSTWLHRPRTMSGSATRLGLVWLPGWPDLVAHLELRTAVTTPAHWLRLVGRDLVWIGYLGRGSGGLIKCTAGA